MQMKLTAAAIAIVAFVACVLVHDVLGRGLATWLIPGVRAISLSSIALETTVPSRLVWAAGWMANIAVGLAALAVFRCSKALSPLSYFLWLLGATNLLSGTGYPTFSVILESGIFGLALGIGPTWSTLLGVVSGAIAYAGVVALSARMLSRVVADAWGLIAPAYFVGCTLLVLASMLNSIGSFPALTSSVGRGFVAMAGLIAMPRLVKRWSRQSSSAIDGVPYSFRWIVAGLAVGLAFVMVLGPGIQL